MIQLTKCSTLKEIIKKKLIIIDHRLLLKKMWRLKNSNMMRFLIPVFKISLRVRKIKTKTILGIKS